MVSDRPQGKAGKPRRPPQIARHLTCPGSSRRHSGSHAPAPVPGCTYGDAYSPAIGQGVSRASSTRRARGVEVGGDLRRQWGRQGRFLRAVKPLAGGRRSPARATARAWSHEPPPHSPGSTRDRAARQEYPVRGKEQEPPPGSTTQGAARLIPGRARRRGAGRQGRRSSGFARYTPGRGSRSPTSPTTAPPHTRPGREAPRPPRRRSGRSSSGGPRR